MIAKIWKNISFKDCISWWSVSGTVWSILHILSYKSFFLRRAVTCLHIFNQKKKKKLSKFLYLGTRSCVHLSTGKDWLILIMPDHIPLSLIILSHLSSNIYETEKCNESSNVLSLSVSSLPLLLIVSKRTYLGNVGLWRQINFDGNSTKSTRNCFNRLRNHTAERWAPQFCLLRN